MCIGCRMAKCPDSRIISISISVNPKNGFPRLPFNTKLLRSHVAMLEVSVTVLDSDRIDGTVAVEPYIMFTAWFRNMGVSWHNSVERAVYSCGYFSFDQTVV